MAPFSFLPMCAMLPCANGQEEEGISREGSETTGQSDESTLGIARRGGKGGGRALVGIYIVGA
jgi:hypothetical protein